MVYIIYTEKHDKYYRGYSINPFRRLEQHNNGESKYTSNYAPWRLVYIQSYESKAEALKREKALKKYSKYQLKDLIRSTLNEL